MNEKHGILCYWILIHGLLAIAIILSIFGFFSKFQEEVERDLVQLHFFNFNQLLKMVILKVTIKVVQGASFSMQGPLWVKALALRAN